MKMVFISSELVRGVMLLPLAAGVFFSRPLIERALGPDGLTALLGVIVGALTIPVAIILAVVGVWLIMRALLD